MKSLRAEARWHAIAVLAVAILAIGGCAKRENDARAQRDGNAASTGAGTSAASSTTHGAGTSTASSNAQGATTPAATVGLASSNEPTISPADVTTRPKLVDRILIIGLDGATWRLMAPLLDQGRMPNVKRLADRGMFYELATLEPTLSPAIWTTIATGRMPSEHGILGFDGVPGETMTTLPNTRMRRVKAYWNILGDFARTTGTVCWWVTWPTEDVGAGSYQVSDRVPYNRQEAAIGNTTLSPQDAQPTSLLEKLSPLVLRPDEIDQAAVTRFLKFSEAETEKLVRAAPYKVGDFISEFKYVYQSDRSILNMGLELLRSNPVDVAAVYFSGIDAVSHLYWHWTFPQEFPGYQIPQEHIQRLKDVIPEYYVLMDEYIGQLVAAAGPNTMVMILSDHGFGGTGRLPWSGGHDRITKGAPIAPPGVLIVSGPHIGHSNTPGKAHVLDIAPTLLYLMGLPASKEMTGRVLMDAMAAGSPAEFPRVDSYERIGRPRQIGEMVSEPEADAERIERLRALGYVK